MDEQHAAAKQLPIACSLDAADLENRRRDMLAELFSTTEGAEATNAGYRFRFTASSEALTRIAAVVDAERQCCRFLRFQLTVEPDFGPLFLEITGPAGTAEFLADLLQI